MDPNGLSLDDFDALGKHVPGNIDVRGNILAAGDVSGDYKGSAELAAMLVDSDTVQECLGRQWFRYAFGRLEQNTDACTFSDLAVSLSTSQGNLAAMFASVSSADGFRYRKTTGHA